MPHTPSSPAQLFDEKAGAAQVLKHSALVLALIAVTITVATMLAFWSGVPAL
jgi:hypothetical protein